MKDVEMKNIITENQNLKNMLALSQQSPQEYIAVNVALVENINESERIFIDKGSKCHYKRNFEKKINNFG